MNVHAPSLNPTAVADEQAHARYQRIRNRTEQLAQPLAIEDYVVQSMTDVSPTKWHLAHVTWFFETFVLIPHLDGYEPLNPGYQYLFNSYYLGAGERHCRDQRGYISRPTVAEVYDYRRHVDEHVAVLLDRTEGQSDEVGRVLEIGLQHEQQHQELLMTDIKHVLSVNPLRPVYQAWPTDTTDLGQEAAPLEWIRVEEGLYEVGARIGDGFSFDNETPRHRYFIDAFDLADRPVTNGEFMSFIEDGGYTRGDLWLSEGWAVAQEREWSEPFYWEMKDGQWHSFTMAGMRPVDPAETAAHISYFEADAYARWAGARLPSEHEWEVAAAGQAPEGNLSGQGRFHPTRAAASQDGFKQLFGDVWEWTRSQYSPYPGYQTLPGTLGEYNGKFMSNQFVLRGGSCVTPDDHIRATYRNFFPADAGWQFSGIRLARDLG